MFFAQKGETKAAQINRSIAEKELQEQKLTLQRQWNKAVAGLQKAIASVTYYEQQGLALAEEQIRTARLGYREGEVDYIAFTQNLDQAITVQEDYLNSLQLYNQAVIEITRLSGESIKK